MKKILFIIFLCFILAGCNSSKIYIKYDDIIEIQYNDLVIMDGDYKNIIDIVNNINFNDKEITGNFNNTLLIKTNNDIYRISISDNYYLKYENNDKILYSSESKNIKQLLNTLTSIKEKYINQQFYTIEYETNYEINNDDFLIKLDNQNNVFIITTSLPINNLRINDIEYIDDNYNDINLIYNNNDVVTNKIIIRKTINKENPNFRISFTTPYNYVVSIIPIYDKNNNKVNYITEFNIKKSP